MGKSRQSADLVSDNNIFVDITNDRVGIGTTNPTSRLTVKGNTSLETLNVSGVSTLSTTNINGNVTITGAGNTSLLVNGNARITGILTVGTGSVTLDESGNVNTIGIITATSFYGDGQYLQNVISGVGVATAGGTVGTGATILDFRGAGISTVTVSSGIATINVTGGGGGGGAVSIGTVPPSSPSNGDLWYSPDYGRTFVWYNEVALGIGSTAVWVDASPFNLKISELDDVQLNSLVVVNHTDLNTLDVSGISTLGNVIIGSGATDLIVNGNARVTGILTIGTSSLTLNGNTNQINGVTISAGIITASGFSGSFTGNATGLSGTPDIAVGNITGAAATFTGNVSVAGTLTYEDVTNVDSVGLVTARAGAHVATSSGSLLVGSATSTGTASQRLQVTGGGYFSGSVGIGTTNPGTRLDVFGAGRIRNIGGTSSLSIGLGQNSDQYAVIDLIGDTTYTAYGLRIIRENSGANTSSRIYHRGTGDLSLYTVDSAPIDFRVSNNSYVTRYTSDGNFLVNNTSATGTLSQRLQVTGGGYFSGSVGIGTTNPQEALHVVGVVTATSYRGDGSQLTGVSVGTDITSCLFT